MFKGSKFDANAWAEMFKQAGAKFAGPVAIHHDNFAMWNSKVTKWNSVNMGPHKDIVGELEKAIKSRGMYFMTSFHHSFTWDYYVPAFDYDARDTAYAGLYTMPHKKGDPPSEEFLKIWLEKINEVVTTYQPSLIWFDMGFGETLSEADQKKMFALYYNWVTVNNIKGVAVQKSESIHKHTGILDFERGREDSITPYPWLTDESIKGDSWFYQPSDHSWKSANELINLLADIVSKNGDLLLNVGPQTDGTFFRILPGIF
jgi:alpha-L-fucosidase